MIWRCANGHEVPRGAQLCALCQAPVQAPRPPAVKRRGRALLAASLLAIVLAGAWLAHKAGTAGASSPVGVAYRVSPAVFKIEVLDSADEEASLGSGFLIGEGGLAASAMHVLRGAFRARGRFSDERIFDVVTVQAWDTLQDLVIFRLGRVRAAGLERPSGIVPLRLRGDRAPTIGEKVVVVGSPEGLTNTISDGLVSGIRETDEGQRIQFTAPSSPGSSGGPVLDAAGRVLGVTVGQYESGQNLNFAVPVQQLEKLLQQHSDVSLEVFSEQTRRHERALSEEGWYAEELLRHGNELFEHDHYAEALTSYEAALAADSTASDVAFNAGLCLVRLHREEDAARMFRRYVAGASEHDRFYDFATRWLTEHGGTHRPN